jgi:DNA-binding transcriptional LysR family regulator
MELRHFRYFSAVAVLGSFSKAAQHLHLTQPALSRQVKDLEDELGILLLRRNKKRISLTPAGESFFADIAAILNLTEEAVRKLKTQKGGELLRVGYVHSLVGSLMPKVAARFQSLAKGVQLEISDMPTETMARRANTGLLDVAVLPKSLEPHFPEFRWTELQRLAPVLIVSCRHPLAKKARISPSQLRNETLIPLSEKTYPEYIPRLRAILKPFGVTPRFSNQQACDIPELLIAVEAQFGSAVLTEGVTKMLTASLRMRGFKPELGTLLIAAGVPAMNSNPHADTFIRLLIEEGAQRRWK